MASTSTSLPLFQLNLFNGDFTPKTRRFVSPPLSSAPIRRRFICQSTSTEKPKSRNVLDNASNLLTNFLSGGNLGSMPTAEGAVTDLFGRPLFLSLYDWFLEHGSVYKLAFGPKAFVVVSDPIVARHILRENAFSYDKLPALQDDTPPSDNYGRFSNRGRSSRGGMSDRRGPSGGSRSPRGWGRSQDSNFGDGGSDSFRRGGRSSRPTGDRWSSNSRSSGDNWLGGGGGRSSRSSGDDWLGGGRSSRSSSDDWLISGGRSSRSSSVGGRRESFSGACFNCGKSGHRATECPNKQTY